ncbi:MAG: tRNA (guanosine(46)-N7)-methyltransferase TrmB [Proteobacteria bacterium]|nr:tRNA (guanosine(46)-N7)-methyltransferase TrmB [Pseudomonadota bacterium]
MTLTQKPPRPIRSYVVRQGRSSKSQQQARDLYWQQYGLNLSEGFCGWPAVFGRDAARVLEIGFGMGDTLITLAKAHPEMDFIGIEVHPPGVGRCLVQAQAHGLTNLKLYAEDALSVLEEAIPDGSLDKVLLYFPDPWPKKKHHKRRIVQSNFVNLVAQKLKPGGVFHMATDWQAYADHMLAILEACPALRNTFGKSTFAPSQYLRPLTKFEARGQKLGHDIWDLVYERR